MTTNVHISDMPPKQAAEVAEAVAAVKANPRVKDVALLAVGGSLAYGLAKPTSDVDIRGVYVAEPEIFLGLDAPPIRPISMSEPDFVLYELGVFFRLALASNPNIVELLYLDRYEELTEVGKALLANRMLFLSQAARKSYVGFATSQLRESLNHLDRMEAGDEEIRGRFEKHVRHTFRILEQGTELIERAEVTVRVADPARFFAFSELPRDELVARFEAMKERIDAAASPLPEVPDRERANQLLLDLRRLHHGR